MIRMDLKEFAHIAIDKAYKHVEDKNWEEASRILRLLRDELSNFIIQCDNKLR